MEQKPIRYADQTWLTIHPQVEEVGNGTTVGTVAFMATVRQIAGNFAVKEGDQVEWNAELKGRITVTRRMLDAATEQMLQ
jgi:hypothetical protein